MKLYGVILWEDLSQTFQIPPDQEAIVLRYCLKNITVKSRGEGYKFDFIAVPFPHSFSFFGYMVML